MTVTTTIAAMLGISPAQTRKFSFEGRDFEYYPASPNTAECLLTRWAEGTRTASPLNLADDAALRQNVAMLLAHRFRKVFGGKAEQIEIIEKARTALAA